MNFKARLNSSLCVQRKEGSIFKTREEADYLKKKEI